MMEDGAARVKCSARVTATAAVPGSAAGSRSKPRPTCGCRPDWLAYPSELKPFGAPVRSTECNLARNVALSGHIDRSGEGFVATLFVDAAE